MKRLMVDMDHVITNGNMERVLEQYLGFKPDFDKFNGYRKQEILGDKKSDFFKWLKDVDYYEKGMLLPSCYNILKKLCEFYEVYIVTDYVWPEKEMIEHNGKFAADKYKFLLKNLNFMNPRQFVFCCNKTLINCDVKLDDRIDNLSGAETKLLFTADHNKNIDDNELKKQNIIRVNSWEEVGRVLKL